MVGRRLPPLPSVGDILRMYNIQAKKALSQNFILDPRILDSIARHANVKDKYVVEVGPGPGGITRSLVKAGAKKVFVIEKDPRFLPSLHLLREAAGGPDKLDIHIGDCLTFNVEKMVPQEAKVPWESDRLSDLVLVGNLPFNVATPFFLKLVKSLEERCNYYTFGKVSAVFTFQNEVALRMCAPPDDPQRSRLSVITQNYLDVKHLTVLPGGSFVPPPEVEVGLIRMIPHEQPFIRDLPFSFVNKVVTGLFMSKNMKYLNSIKINLFPTALRGDFVPALAKAVDIDHMKTPVQLTMEEISRICYTYKAISDVLLQEEGIDLLGYHSVRGQKADKEMKAKLEDFQHNVVNQGKPSRFDIKFN